jgi:hypothetical protein
MADCSARNGDYVRCFHASIDECENGIAYADTVLMTEDWQRNEMGLRQARKLLHLCLPISGNTSANSEWGPWGEAHRHV